MKIWLRPNAGKIKDKGTWLKRHEQKRDKKKRENLSALGRNEGLTTKGRKGRNHSSS